jgi:hypothetical protein
MAQAVSRRPVTTESRVCARVNPRGICSGQSGPETGFSPSSSVFPYHHHHHCLNRLRNFPRVASEVLTRTVVPLMSELCSCSRGNELSGFIKRYGISSLAV